MGIALRNYAKVLSLPRYQENNRAKPSFFEQTWTLCPFRKRLLFLLPPKMALCMHVDTICTQPCFLGAAKLLRQYQQDLVGTVKLVFQPDEEGFTGAKAMLKAGVLENPHVDAGIAFHIVSGIPSGTVMCGSGTCMAGCTLFQIHIKGTGCHGAMPETGVDPINIAAHIYLSLQEIIAREIAPTQPAALTIGRFSAGEAPNIIPEEVILEGTIRTMDCKISKYIFDRIEEISTQTASLFSWTRLV